ncbi:MAG TPA: hypothetical protein VHH88_03455 [Verrucomicrobiae bacterium]|nr:hypothetical protein [Verrucomicrobiae bacterium]
MFCVLTLLLALGRTALAQVEPALPGSIEYELRSNNQTWIETSDPITVGSYVLDLLSDSRWNQPDGRGAIGIVTETGWDADYNTMAAVVDFGRDYTAGIVFPELSAIEVVPVPEPALVWLLLPAALLGCVAMKTRQSAKAAFHPPGHP